MGCQKKIAKKITEKKGDYVFGLKGNHGQLKEDVELFFTDQQQKEFKKLKHDYCCLVNKDHGRFEVRKCWITEEIDWLEDKKLWAGLRSIIMLESSREISNNQTTETRFYISSLSADDLKASNAIREHWGIENSLHWILDVTFREDDSRIRKDNAPENLAIIRHAVVNMLQQHKTKKLSIKRLRKMAGWDSNLLDMILCTKF